MMFSPPLLQQAETILTLARSQSVMIATAESCTGGLIVGLLTDIAGSSDVVERGFVTYSNNAKETLLGVSAELLNAHGAVSQEVAMAMAEGALAHSQAQLSVSVTGIAGPTGGDATKPVGLVHIASAFKRFPTLHQTHHFTGDRQAVRIATVKAACELLLSRLG